MVALSLPEMPLGSRESWGAAPALAVFPTTLWTPALHKTSLSRRAAWDPALCPPRALTLHHSLPPWVWLLLREEAGDEKEAQDPRVLLHYEELCPEVSQHHLHLPSPARG